MNDDIIDVSVEVSRPNAVMRVFRIRLPDRAVRALSTDVTSLAELRAYTATALVRKAKKKRSRKRKAKKSYNRKPWMTI